MLVCAQSPAPGLLVRDVGYVMRRASLGFGVRHGHALEAEGLRVGNMPA